MSPTHEIKVNGKGDGRKITNMELRGYHDQRGTRGKGESQIGAEMLHTPSRHCEIMPNNERNIMIDELGFLRPRFFGDVLHCDVLGEVEDLRRGEQVVDGHVGRSRRACRSKSTGQ